MDTSRNDAQDEYHALLARRDAMRLRRQLLSPGRTSPLGHTAVPGGVPGGSPGGVPAGAGQPPPDPDAYDGAADRETITRYLPFVTPFDALIEHLYAAMFERHPYLRGLFPDSMDFQRAHLEQAFWYLIEHLDRPREVADFCARLGRDHRKLGVQPVHYEVFEQALTEALRRAAGPHWAPEPERAWLRMLRFAVASMVAGAAEALAEPPYWNGTVTAHELRRPDLAVLRVRTAEPFPYRAGQYTRLQSPLLPLTWRPYSIARAPRPDGELEFHVRRTGPGGVSDALVTGTRAGDTLRLGPAQGTTTLDDDPAREVLIVAGGTGWATARALLEELAKRPLGRTAHVFVGARALDDLYDTTALSKLEDTCPWLRVVPVLGEGPGGTADGSVADAVARHTDWSGHLAYVSGPPRMITATVRALTARHLPPDRVRHDPVADAAPAPLPRALTRG
ncbi:globin domain-containing protein [Streptomyces sp. LP11]|uniref:nitric oxide dioxygenase n=2 Tax=Streptomyces pyxinicus TaxID=2970331 RepID=A0ABT2AV21_9ACTN|nr:globin domain-containing protein [Streptomyces sp. LP11]MCS0600102.1 globin domain-containing protein [Streptomyces sp. LP11]